MAPASLCALVAVCALVLTPTAQARQLVSGGISLVAPLLGFWWLLQARAMSPLRRERHALRRLALCAGVVALAGAVSLVPGAAAPAPAVIWPCLAALVSYPLLWAGLTRRLGRVSAELPGRSVLVCDVLLTLGAVLIIAYHLSVPALAASPRLAFLTRVAGMTDLTLALATLVPVILVVSEGIPRELHGPRALLVNAVLLIVAGDSVASYLLLHRLPEAAGYAHAVGALGFLWIGVAMRWQMAADPRRTREPPTVDPFPAMLGTLLPACLVAAAVALGIRSCLLMAPLDYPRLVIVSVSTAGLVALVLIRQVVTFTNTRHLYLTLQRVYAEVAHSAATDSLTGLANHRRFMERLAAEMRRATRYHRPLAVIFADLDRFKQINDSYGHAVGDRALRAAAERLSSAVRDADLVARYGGEEFVVLLPETSLAQATALAERLRQSVEAMHLPLRLPGVLRCTVSCGVAAYPTSADTLEGLLAAADHAMYLAKEAGRNQVAVASAAASSPPRRQGDG